MINRNDQDKSGKSRPSADDKQGRMIEDLKKIEAVAAEERRLLGELRKKLEIERRGP